MYIASHGVASLGQSVSSSVCVVASGGALSMNLAAVFCSVSIVANQIWCDVMSLYCSSSALCVSVVMYLL
jgi:hypothetical protein